MYFGEILKNQMDSLNESICINVPINKDDCIELLQFLESEEGKSLRSGKILKRKIMK